MAPYYKNGKEKEILILRSAVESTNEGFITIDQDHTVVFYNKGAEKIFGYRAEEVLGRDLDLILTPDCAPDHYEAVKRYLETKRPKKIGHIAELIATRRSGEKFPVNISFSTFELEGRIYFTAIITDLTEIKELQERAKRMERLALLGRVVAEIAHEIKNPLMMIGGFANQVLRNIKEEKNKKKLGIIIDEVERLENLLARLKEYYSPPPSVSDRINISKIIKDISSLIKGELEDREIILRVDIPEHELYIKGNEEKLRQVIINIMRNGIEAMENGGELHLSLQKKGDLVEIRITDTGRGIPENIQDKIFLPFFTTKSGGSGLGLGISKKIVEDHNGSLSFKTKEGEGTTFIIRLPVSSS